MRAILYAQTKASMHIGSDIKIYLSHGVHFVTNDPNHNYLKSQDGTSENIGLGLTIAPLFCGAKVQGVVASPINKCYTDQTSKAVI